MRNNTHCSVLSILISQSSLTLAALTVAVLLSPSRWYLLSGIINIRFHISDTAWAAPKHAASEASYCQPTHTMIQCRHGSQGSAHLLPRWKLATSESFQWGSWHGSHLNQGLKQIILFPGSPCLLHFLQPFGCYCRSIMLHPFSTRLSLIGNPFKSCISKCFGRRLPERQDTQLTCLKFLVLWHHFPLQTATAP